MGRNLKNAAIAFLVPLPSILFYLSFLNHYYDSAILDTDSNIWTWCYHHPLLLPNALLFLNVTLLFWVIGLVQCSHWMIDLYWTVIPVMLVHYCASHPWGECNWWRSRVVIFLTWLWSVRLCHNYFRRENWQWGARQDWRFTNMSLSYGNHWWWISFFTVYISQQMLLITLSLPFYAIHSVNKPLSIMDLVATVLCSSGILIAYFADTQLHNFVTRNNNLKYVGKPIVPVLDKGLWYYSRHPNYFGEQLWWWGLALYTWNIGYGWTLVGTIGNTLCLAYVTKLVEERMLRQKNRTEAYTRYQKTTSIWIPWFKVFDPSGVRNKNA
ncbi:hypothetical protein K1719_026993 [Acacia pycnantha]|nr:hypothetical protein K1719_026993 [Acacia pycnantha]